MAESPNATRVVRRAVLVLVAILLLVAGVFTLTRASGYYDVFQRGLAGAGSSTYLLFAIVTVPVALLLLTAGIGVLAGREWGKTLGLTLAIISAFFTAFALVHPTAGSVISMLADLFVIGVLVWDRRPARGRTDPGSWSDLRRTPS